MPWDDNLDDFERQLAADKKAREAEEAEAGRQASSTSRKDKEHRHRRHEEKSHRRRHQHHSRHGHHDNENDHRHHGSSGSHRNSQGRRGDDHHDHIDEQDRHRNKRRRRSRDDHDRETSRDREEAKDRRSGHEEAGRRKKHRGDDRDEDEEEQRSDREDGGDVAEEEKDESSTREEEEEEEEGKEEKPVLQRDAWMQAPSALDVDYVHRRAPAPDKNTQDPIRPGSPRARLDLKIHEAELNKHYLQELASGSGAEKEEGEKGEPSPPSAERPVDYEFGDSGSRWRMMKLRNVYREASESGKPVDEVALRQYGTLRAFDDAREEETELDRRRSYGEGYKGKTKPSGELFRERKLEADDGNDDNDPSPAIQATQDDRPPVTTTVLDPTALNRLRAQMMKAKLKGLPEAATLEREYEAAQQASESGNGQPGDVVVLNAMENRMLAGKRSEVQEAGKRRARERGQMEESESMSIEDMVREERRTKGIFGNEDKRFASRIAKDGKFTNDLDYMDENATRLAKRVHQSDAALRSSAIAQHRQTASVLGSCPLCHHEDRPHDALPVAPVVSLAHRTFLTLPTNPEVSPHGGAIIAPLAHHDNLLGCDDDEWEEMRNFMKALARMYFSRKLGVLFYENAAHPRKHRHAALAVVPVPLASAEDSPAFFREAILASDDEWAQHRKIIDTRGKGRNGFRRSLAKEVPYFHVWTELDGGLGHVIEDERRWPRGDLFAREVLGGMLRVGAEVWRRQGRWDKSSETLARVDRFRKTWDKFDWTKMLVDDDGGL